MFRTIIVPLDGSEAAEAAVPYAADEAEHHGARIVLLQVVPQPELSHVRIVRGPLPIVYAYPEDEQECLFAEATRYLHSVVDRYGLEMRTVISVEFGDSYLRIKSAIERYAAPLVVVATPAHGRHRIPFLPMALEELIREGLAPVLVVRGAGPIRRAEELPVAAGVTQSLVDQPLQWEDLIVVDARVAGSN